MKMRERKKLLWSPLVRPRRLVVSLDLFGQELALDLGFALPRQSPLRFLGNFGGELFHFIIFEMGDGVVPCVTVLKDGRFLFRLVLELYVQVLLGQPPASAKCGLVVLLGVTVLLALSDQRLETLADQGGSDLPQRVDALVDGAVPVSAALVAELLPLSPEAVVGLAHLRGGVKVWRVSR